MGSQYPLPAYAWLSIEAPTCWDLAAVWLIRGATPDHLESDVPTAVLISTAKGERTVAVIIGVDPHKGSHTAVAVDEKEQQKGELRVRTGADQLERLLAFGATFGQRTWAIENASGLGYLLAQQLVAAGEAVVDVPPKLAARVRLLNTGSNDKNDPNDAYSVAVAALRSSKLARVQREDHAMVAKLWAKRHKELSRARNKVACRLHARLCELVPGGYAGEIYVNVVARLLEDFVPEGAVQAARHDLARELLEDLRRFDEQLRASKRRLAAVVQASGSSLTNLFGVGPVNAALIIGYTAGVGRFATRDRFAAYTGTAPIEVSSGNHETHRLSLRGNRQLNHAIHMVAVTQLRFPGTEGRLYYERKLAEGKTGKEAIRALKRRLSDRIYATLVKDARRTEAEMNRGLGGQSGNDSVSSAAGSHPEDRLFERATPRPVKSLRRSAKPGASRASGPRRRVKSAS